MSGWLRLWIVLSIIGVPVTAVLLAQNDMATWERLDATSWDICLKEQTGSYSYDAYKACGHKYGADQTIYQHEHTTAWRFWGLALLIGFAADLFITAVVWGCFAAVRWIVRGFV